MSTRGVIELLSLFSCMFENLNNKEKKHPYSEVLCDTAKLLTQQADMRARTLYSYHKPQMILMQWLLQPGLEKHGSKP